MHGEPVPKREPRGSSCGTVCMQLAKHSHARGRADSLTKTVSPIEMRFQGHISYKQKVPGGGGRGPDDMGTREPPELHSQLFK